MPSITSFFHRHAPAAVGARRERPELAEVVVNRALGRAALDAFLQGGAGALPTHLPTGWEFLRYPYGHRLYRDDFVAAGGQEGHWPNIDVAAFAQYLQPRQAAKLQGRARKVLDAWAIALCDTGNTHFPRPVSDQRARVLLDTLSLLMAPPPACLDTCARLEALLPVLRGKSKALPALVYRGDAVDRLITAALMPKLPWDISLPTQVAQQLGLWLPPSVKAERVITLLYIARRHGVRLPKGLRMNDCPPGDAAALRGLLIGMPPGERAHYAQTELLAPALCALPSNQLLHLLETLPSGALVDATLRDLQPTQSAVAYLVDYEESR